ncbi:MAG TPA: neutral zinc metallopeptidase, partial [Acidobacteriaceae bacterium]
VIAHELGHHVQDLTGGDAKVQRMERAEPGERNQLSVETELQAIAMRACGRTRRNSGGLCRRATSMLL